VLLSGDSSPLVTALERGDAALARFLAERGGRELARRKREDGVTALHFAANLGLESLVKLLLAEGSDVDASAPGFGSALCVAALASAREAAAALLDAGAEPDLRCDVADDKKPTPLLLAVERRDAATVRTLLSTETEPPGRAADPDAGAGERSVFSAPLLLAVARGAGAPVVEALLAAGANCAILVASRGVDHPPENLLDVARQRRDYDVLQLLMAHQDACDVSAADIDAR